MRAFGYVGMSIDILYNDYLYDALTPLGFCIFIAGVWRIRRLGCVLAALPCSSWVRPSGFLCDPPEPGVLVGPGSNG